jgi:carboxymethylenebutenolidase
MCDTDDDLKREFSSPDIEPTPGWTRREFVMSALASATGLALATTPAWAQMITTDAQGLTAGDVRISARDMAIPAYRAMPATSSGFPVVLVVADIYSVNEHFKDVCRRLAKLGYMAIAPRLYERQGDVTKLTENAEIQDKIMSRVPDAQVMSDLDATVAWAAKNDGNIDKLGMTGFCWGGRKTWIYAAHNPALKAGVAWYGRFIDKRTELVPKHPIDVVEQLNAPVLGLYGGADPGIPVSTVDEMRAALKKAGKPAEIIVYPDAPHAFNADYRTSYRKEAAQDGWKRMLEWFRKYGVA